MNPDDPITRIQERRQQQTDTQLEDKRFNSIVESQTATKDSLSKSMHDLLMATVIGKDPKVAEVAKNLANLLQSIAKASKDVENSGLSNVKKVFEDILGELSSLPDKVAQTDKSGDLIPYLESIHAAISKVKTNPTVRVSPVIDLSGVEKAIENINSLENEGIDLSCYRAQDIDNTDPNIQYVGFVDPKGCWYIIENNELDNSLRYKFGESDYQDAWINAPKFEYRVLNEAIDEIKA